MPDRAPARGTVMQGKRGLIMGVTNDRSLGWGIAAVCAAFTYQVEALERRVRPLAESVGSDRLFLCDVGDETSIDAAFAALGEQWGGLDFVVHAIAFADKQYLRGRYLDTPREAFLQEHDITTNTFVALAPRNRGTDLNGLTQLLAGFRGFLNGTLVLLQEPALADVRNALAGGSASYRPTCSGFGPAI